MKAIAQSLRHRNWQLGLATSLVISGAIIAPGNYVFAQIVPDGTLGTERSVVTPNVNINGLPSDQIDGGAIRGTNLFHSFLEFNVSNQRAAYFISPPEIQNILTRVTGTQPSNILGTLGVNGSNANLFLINPNGIIFGENARLSVNGSFVATSANAIGLANGDIFSVNPADPLPNQLLNVNPNAFFLNQITAESAKPIINRSRANPNNIGLQVPTGRSLLLVGGEVKLEGGRMQAAGGRVELGGLANPGIVGLSSNGGVMSLSFPDGVARANVSLTGRAGRNNNGARVDVAAGGGGSIAITAQNLQISGGSSLSAAISEDLGLVGAKAGDITLNATGEINVIGNSSRIENRVNREVTGDGGNIYIQANSLSVRDSARISANTSGEGNAGSVIVRVDGAVTLANSGKITSEVADRGVGNGGNIDIQASSLSVINNGSELSTTVVGKGNGGSILVQVDGSVTVEGGGNTRVSSDVGNGAIGNGGNIDIQAESLYVINAAQDGRTSGPRLTASTRGQGDAGSVSVRVEGLVSLEDADIFSEVLNRAKGEGGDINIRAGSLFMNNSSRLTTRTFGEGMAGDINVQVDDSVRLEDGGRITSDVASGAASVSNGGDINIQARSLTAVRGGFLQASTGVIDDANNQPFTRQGGKAGRIRVNASDFIDLSGVDRFRPNASQRTSGFYTSSETGTKGPGSDGGNIDVTTGDLRLSDGAVLNARSYTGSSGGNIFVNANTLELTSGGQLLTTAFSNGDAGDITVNVTDSITLSGSSPSYFELVALAEERLQTGEIQRREQIIANDGAASGLLVRTQGSGNAGDLMINTGQLIVRDGAIVSAGTFGEGIGGKIVLNANSVDVSGVGLDGSSSGLFTSTAGSGKGGNITIDTNTLQLADAAVVDARTTAEGNGGDIKVSANSIEATNGGQILTTTRSSGDAGTITLNATDRVILSGSDPTYTDRVTQFGSDNIPNEGAASGVFANTTETSTGGGGSLSITTGQLIVQDTAQVSVSNQGIGNAGNLDITANSILLDKDAALTAITRSGNGGNIRLQVQDLLLMRNKSRIATDAGTDQAGGDGGNMTIDAPFIIAVPSENSDITANAYEGRGGNINITTQGIYGLQFRPNLTPLSDITASSQLGVDGAVTINTPDVDPSRGLVGLPTELVDASNQIARNCSGGGAVAQNRFVVTGRGGMPPNPGEPLSNDTVWTDLRLNSVAVERIEDWETGSQNSVLSPFTTASAPIVEATGWVKGSNGETILTAQAPTVTSSSSWQTPTKCHVP